MFYSFQKNTFLSVAFIFFCSIFIFSCNKKTAPTFINTSNPNNPIKILALGDSYTIGQSIATEERFINKTIALINANGLNLKSPPQIFAQTGWTTQNLLNEIEANSISFAPLYDIVTLLIGVNDQYQQFDTAAYRINFTACINKALEFSGNRRNRVFVLSIPDYGATAFGSSNAVQIGKEIDQYNAINKQITLQMKINYINITPSSRKADNDATLVAIDGLHPSGKEYLKWAKLLLPKILPLLK